MHRPGTLHHGPFHPAFIIREMQHISSLSRGPVLRGTQQTRRAAHLPSVQAKAVQQPRPLLRDVCLQPSGGKHIRIRSLIHIQPRRRKFVRLPLFSYGLETDGFRSRRYDSRHPHPFDGTVRPISQRPTVRRQARAVGLQTYHPVFLQFPFQERNAQADRTVHRRTGAHPTQIPGHRALAIKDGRTQPQAQTEERKQFFHAIVFKMDTKFGISSGISNFLPNFALHTS